MGFEIAKAGGSVWSTTVMDNGQSYITVSIARDDEFAMCLPCRPAEPMWRLRRRLPHSTGGLLEPIGWCTMSSQEPANKCRLNKCMCAETAANWCWLLNSACKALFSFCLSLKFAPTRSPEMCFTTQLERQQRTLARQTASEPWPQSAHIERERETYNCVCVCCRCAKSMITSEQLVACCCFIIYYWLQSQAGIQRGRN